MHNSLDVDPGTNDKALNIQSMTDINISNKVLLIREDLNVPIREGSITNDARLKAALPTIKLALSKGAQVILMSHLGRPKEGEFDESMSLQPVADYLTKALAQEVPLVRDWTNAFFLGNRPIVLLENVRFNRGEKKNDPELAKKMANFCDIFVMDAFGTAHRAQASTEGVARYAPQVCAGPLLTAELAALGQALQTPKPPVIAIVGGAKVSSKLSVLTALASKVDQIIVGGGIANTFIAAKGYPVGKSLYEPELIEEAKKIMSLVDIPIPQDVVTATEFSEQAEPNTKMIEHVQENEMILDIGPKSAEKISSLIRSAGTILWNGPLGVFELTPFSQGTRALATAIAGSSAFSIAGGGDTLAAIDAFGVSNDISYISTGGGAFLEFLEGKTLPAVAVLESRTKELKTKQTPVTTD